MIIWSMTKSAGQLLKRALSAHSQQVVRADKEDTFEISARIEKIIMDRFASVADQIKALIISDTVKVLSRGLFWRNYPCLCWAQYFCRRWPQRRPFLSL